MVFIGVDYRTMPRRGQPELPDFRLKNTISGGRNPAHHEISLF